MGLCQSCLHTRERDELRVAMQATILATGIDEPHFWKMYTQFKQANKAHSAWRARGAAGGRRVPCAHSHTHSKHTHTTTHDRQPTAAK